MLIREVVGHGAESVPVLARANLLVSEISSRSYLTLIFGISWGLNRLISRTWFTNNPIVPVL